MLASAAIHIVGPVVTKSSEDWTAAAAVAAIFAALATFVLAGFTARLASQTTQLARETKSLAATTAKDIAGQRRPIITTIPTRSATYSLKEDETLVTYLYNSGSGPALDVRALLLQTGEDARTPEDWPKGALPPAVEFPLKFWAVRQPAPEERLEVEVSYRDIDGRNYTSHVMIRCTDSVPHELPVATLQVVDVVIEAEQRETAPAP